MTATINLEDSGGMCGQAWQFAQFLKRITFNGVRECAVDNDEAYEMLDIIAHVQKQLAEQGIEPR